MSSVSNRLHVMAPLMRFAMVNFAGWPLDPAVLFRSPTRIDSFNRRFAIQKCLTRIDEQKQFATFGPLRGHRFHFLGNIRPESMNTHSLLCFVPCTGIVFIFWETCDQNR